MRWSSFPNVVLPASAFIACAYIHGLGGVLARKHILAIGMAGTPNIMQRQKEIHGRMLLMSQATVTIDARVIVIGDDARRSVGDVLPSLAIMPLVSGQVLTGG